MGEGRRTYHAGGIFTGVDPVAGGAMKSTVEIRGGSGVVDRWLCGSSFAGEVHRGRDEDGDLHGDDRLLEGLGPQRRAAPWLVDGLAGQISCRDSLVGRVVVENGAATRPVVWWCFEFNTEV